MLNIENLHVNFSVMDKQLHAVRGGSFHLAPGEVVGIVGESGSGKTALAKMLLKLHPPHAVSFSGKVLYQGVDLLSLSEKELQRVRGKEIGMIFQDPLHALNPTLKIGKQIIEGYLRHHGGDGGWQEAYDHALSLLDLVGISHPLQTMEAYPHMLSGGMRQRAMIAIALAPRPNLLIADEPTTALDVTIQAQILDLFRHIQKTLGMGILLITHDLSVVASICDRVLVMYAGKIVESADVYDLFTHPRHPYTKKLLAAVPRIDLSKQHPLSPIEGTPPNMFDKVEGCAFCNRCPLRSSQCQEEEPLLRSVRADHFIACHHHD